MPGTAEMSRSARRIRSARSTDSPPEAGTSEIADHDEVEDAPRVAEEAPTGGRRTAGPARRRRPPASSGRGRAARRRPASITASEVSSPRVTALSRMTTDDGSLEGLRLDKLGYLLTPGHGRSLPVRGDVDCLRPYGIPPRRRRRHVVRVTPSTSTRRRRAGSATTGQRRAVVRRERWSVALVVSGSGGRSPARPALRSARMPARARTASRRSAGWSRPAG